ncbi:MAG: TolC family protein [Pseudomonadota bacterium]
MTARTIILSAVFWGLVFTPAMVPLHTPAAETAPPMNLAETVQAVLEANLQAKNARQAVAAAESRVGVEKTKFLPTFSAAYQYKHHYEEILNPIFGITTPENEYRFTASVTQPVFTGYAITNAYKLAGLGLDIAKLNDQLIRQQLVFEAKNAYFSVLKAEKVVGVGLEAVALLEAFEKDAKNFYDVGMTAQNDFLKAQVELANTRQQLITANNALDVARANFNTLLRRSVNQPVVIVDESDFSRIELTVEACMAEAEKNRLEILVAKKRVAVSDKEVELVKKDYFPTVDVQGNYYKAGTEIQVNGGPGVSDPESWDVRAVATWNFWQWGRTRKGVEEKRRQAEQTQNEFQQVLDNIQLEVKKVYLKVTESEQNIRTVETAISQAKENYRISEERYKQHVATSTDVLDARTLLSRTQFNYYTALYDLEIAKAALARAMGRESLQ